MDSDAAGTRDSALARESAAGAEPAAAAEEDSGSSHATLSLSKAGPQHLEPCQWVSVI